MIIGFKVFVTEEEIRKWLSTGSDQLKQKLINTTYQNNLNKVRALECSLRILKININKNEKKSINDANNCVWVPAAFNNNLNGRRVYGGVSMPIIYKQVAWTALQVGVSALTGLLTGGASAICMRLGRTVLRYAIKRSLKWLYNKMHKNSGSGSSNNASSNNSSNHQPPKPPRPPNQMNGFIVQRRTDPKTQKQWFYRYQVKDGQKILVGQGYKSNNPNSNTQFYYRPYNCDKVHHFTRHAKKPGCNKPTRWVTQKLPDGTAGNSIPLPKQ